jgi:2-keto-3-deoxy-L-rhamnonate aldolase RhmA
MKRNRTQEILARGEPVFGCFLRQPDAGLAELLALRGFDFVIFDGEHGTLSPQACEHLARAVELHDVTPIVRVEANCASSIMRYLDAGALGCHVPDVASPGEAMRAVRAVKFRPAGDRGLSASRASGFGADGYSAYVAEANQETQVIVHIESVAGVDASEAIAAVEGVDVLLFGAVDLSHDIGRPGQVEDPEILDAARRVAAAAATAGKVMGTVTRDASDVSTWLERGARYVAITFEALMAPGIDGFLAQARRARTAREEVSA